MKGADELNGLGSEVFWKRVGGGMSTRSQSVSNFEAVAPIFFKKLM